ncbi:division/outer membrane stress-associated lipid-binding lipoprotein [Ferrimonas gelatinilytica]|uniref:Division/outer membrane stress-associated lipid-binding lipoprotein n=1 Tax=Ferrimonas gelatinilytica TaxID=1255257 RepID=A0ABP9SCY3_9GAMM
MHGRWFAALLLVTQLSGCAGLLMAGAVGGAVVANDRRTLGSQIDDHALEVKMASAIREHDDLADQTRISAISMNRQVLLVGQVPNRMLHDKAIKVLKELDEVEVLHDQLRRGTPIGLGISSQDSWITTKVKSRMFSDGELDAMRIKVITENGEVFLLGLVDQEEANQAVEIARTTAGVRKVVKVFEYR